ncbi:hypothetical protein HG530_000413 [Fusarium avenaceum]|nr:hypothetical protein HG530_000413 [Fusarium avenaceum]
MIILACLTLLATCGNLEEHSSAVRPLAKSLIHTEVSLALQLDEVVLLKVGDAGIDQGIGLGSSDVGEEVVKVVVLVYKMQLEVEILDGRSRLVQASDNGVTPGHQSDLLVVVERSNIGLVKQELRAECDLLVADIRVLDMLGPLLLVRLLRASSDGDSDGVLLVNGHESRHNRIEHSLVDGPDCCPVHGHDVSAGSLLQHELAESGNGQTAAKDTADGGQTRVVPAANTSSVDNLGKLSLGKECSDEVDTGKLPKVNLADLENIHEPVVLLVAIGVLGRSERVGDTLETVDDRAGIVVVFSAQIGTSLHLSEHSQTLLGRAVTSLAGKTVLAVVLLNLRVGIIGVGVAVEDHLLAHLVELLEVVAGVSDLSVLDIHQLEIVENGVLELLLLLGGVCIIESDEELAVAIGGSLGEVVVEESGLGVTNVKTNVVVGTTGALLLSSVELLVELRVSILNELEPSGDVGVGALSDKANGDLAGAESSPDLLVCLSQAVASEVGSESEVLVEVSDHGSRGLEVGCGEHWSRALGVEAHDGGVVEEGRYRMRHRLTVTPP